ncbi:PAS domain-containing hybrid sensor histidine kinase/response regulator [Limnoglobus roseus]|uniref:PAS domain-containing hybrid sensor histidine kinase/response regulator n=1 Tax=Limnoglobus roseus TaxID=2598579 RepID=UPI001FE627DC|nr:PAS domain S-box protein [Limnoglobus roseus]
MATAEQEAGRAREERGLWRTTLSSIGDAVISTDVEGRVTFMNPVAEKLTGWPVKDAQGQLLTEVFRIVNESTREKVDNPALRALKTGHIVGLANHTILLARDGTEYPIDDSAAPIRDETGSVSGAVLVFRDITERNHAEQERARLAAIVESSNDAIVGKSLDGIVQTWNAGAERLFGYSPAEMVGNSIRILLPPERRHEEDVILSKIRRGERIEQFETVRVRKGGERVHVSVSISPIRDGHGEIVGASKTARDITESKRIAHALAESRRRSESALQAGEVGTYYWDIPANQVSGDRNFVAIFGVQPNEATALPVERFVAAIHADDRSRVEEEIARTLRDATPFRSEYRVTGPAGDRWVLARGAVERGASGDPVGWSGVVVDVTDRKVAEAAVRASDERFRIVAQATNDAVWDWDMRTNGVWWNEGVVNLFGYRREQVGGDATWWYEHIHSDDRDRVVGGIHAVIDHGGSSWSDEYRFLKADGGYATVLDRGYGIREDGKTVRVVGAMQDVTERRRAEERLRESEARFRSLFVSMDEGYCVIEPVFDAADKPVDYRYQLINPAFEAHNGLVDAVGKTALEVMPHHETSWIEAYGNVALTGEPLRRVDQAADLGRWFDVSAFRVGAPGARQVAVLFTNVTDRVRAEAMLREKDTRLKLMLDTASDYAVVISDTEGVVLDWLGGAEAITGYAASDVVGKPADVFFTPEDRAAGVPKREMATAASAGRAEDKRWHQKKGGEQFFADGVMVALHEDGTLRGFGKVFRDATARKRADDAVQFMATATASLAELVDYQSTLGRIANMATDVFADWCVVDILDQDGVRKRLTVTAPESKEIRAARTADAAFAPDDATAGVVPHVLKTGQAEVVPELSALDPETAPQGKERLDRLKEMGVRSYLSVPLLSRGQVLGSITFLATSTRRRLGSEELRVAQTLAERVTVSIENAQLYRALQEQDRRKDEFLATLAHELRNPLAPVRNGVQILRAAVPPEPRLSRTLGMMERQLGQMVHLVDDLMDVSRVSSGKVALRRESLPLRAVVDAAVEISRQLIEAASHKLVVNLPEEPIILDGDQTRLVQVLANLLNNAAKYTPHGGQISLSAQAEGEEAVIRVLDTGVGIPPDMLPKVFDMFTQVGTSLERSQGGLGIGLTLVRRLVEMHGGRVTVESPGTGKGSTFTVHLPLATRSPKASEIAGGDPGPEKSKASLDILVVDDNRDSAESLGMLLEIGGHTVKTAHDGPEALQILARFRPQLILLDLGLPGMSGYEIARRIRHSIELRGVRLVALTGWGQEEDRKRTKEAGFDHHLVKPADPVEVKKIVDGIKS